MKAIMKRDLLGYFSSPIGYVIIAAFLLYTNYFFYYYNIRGLTSSLSYVFSEMTFVLCFTIPLVTMRLLSEEKKQKTEQGLLTAPVSLTGIVLGKYFAALTMYVIAVSIAFVYGLILSLFGTVAWMTVLSNYLAILLVGGAFIAVGLFISSLTENQVAAAAAGIICLLMFFLVDTLAARVSISWLQTALYGLSFYTRYYAFTCGIFDISSVLFFISTAVLFNFFTVRVFEKRRWS